MLNKSKHNIYVFALREDQKPVNNRVKVNINAGDNTQVELTAECKLAEDSEKAVGQLQKLQESATNGDKMYKEITAENKRLKALADEKDNVISDLQGHIEKINEDAEAEITKLKTKIKAGQSKRGRKKKS